MNIDTSSRHVIELEPPLVCLVFEREGELYRCALYRRIHRKKTYSTVRDTAKAKTLEDMLRGVFATDVMNETAREIFDYIRSTE